MQRVEGKTSQKQVRWQIRGKSRVKIFAKWALRMPHGAYAMSSTRRTVTTAKYLLKCPRVSAATSIEITVPKLRRRRAGRPRWSAPSLLRALVFSRSDAARPVAVPVQPVTPTGKPLRLLCLLRAIGPGSATCQPMNEFIHLLRSDFFLDFELTADTKAV
jgi:hypothetical protein